MLEMMTSCFAKTVNMTPLHRLPALSMMVDSFFVAGCRAVDGDGSGVGFDVGGTTGDTDGTGVGFGVGGKEGGKSEGIGVVGFSTGGKLGDREVSGVGCHNRTSGCDGLWRR